MASAYKKKKKYYCTLFHSLNKVSKFSSRLDENLENLLRYAQKIFFFKNLMQINWFCEELHRVWVDGIGLYKKNFTPLCLQTTQGTFFLSNVTENNFISGYTG